MKKYLIIYHCEDNDGVFSAAIASEYIKSKFPDAKIDAVGLYYRQMSAYDINAFADWNKDYDSVIMVDISMPDDMMKKAWEMLGNKFVWIDHHAPIIKASLKKGFHDIPGERSTNKSALLLTWKFFFDPLSENKPPYILRILSAWDSFTFEEEGIDKDFAYDVNTGVTQYYDLRLDRVRKFVAGLIEMPGAAHESYFMEIGHTINKYNERRYQEAIQKYGDFQWTVGGRPAIALFLQEPTSSLIFKSAQRSAMKNGIVFKKNGKTATWTVSLYNINDDDAFHCGEYMKQAYNGGGHVGAAGCQLSDKDFTAVLKSKSL